MKYSIIIPTYNHCEDLLKPCINSIKQYTDLATTEIIVVANGCVDNTKDYIESLGNPFKLIWNDEPLGYTKSVNLGIQHASGDYIVLLNNDTILLFQETNLWLHLLEAPFMHKDVGITGPVKFSWDCGNGSVQEALAFWLVMIRKEVFNKIGLLNEVFSPGMGEDGDFCIRASQAGYRLVSVPSDITDAFDAEITNREFPIYHVGNGTFNDNPDYKNSVIDRNNQILFDWYGKPDTVKYSIIIPTYNHCDDLLRPAIESILKNTDVSLIEFIIVANGCTDNTWEYLFQLRFYLKNHLIVSWADEPLGFSKAINRGIKKARTENILLFSNDCLVLDFYPKNQWIYEFENAVKGNVKIIGNHVLHSPITKREFIVFYCTLIKKEVFDKVGLLDEDFKIGGAEDIDFCYRAQQHGYEIGLVAAEELPGTPDFYVNTFPLYHKAEGTVLDTELVDDFDTVIKNNYKLLEEKVKIYESQPKKYSIVIPTYNHCDDLLKPCIDSIIKYSDMSQIELIVCANGCTDNTREYLDSIHCCLKVIWAGEAIGYTRAANLGIKEATGEYVVLLNNDTELLPQNQNSWLDQMRSMFDNDPAVGITGPLELYDNYSNHPALIFFCVMMRKKLFDEIGLLDEVFAPGGGEDIDFSIRATNLGYKVLPLTKTEYNGTTNVGEFPIWHKDNKTFGEISEYGRYIIKRNGLINCKRYNKDIRLNLGAGGIDYTGFLSVDLYDERANINMDITKLDFDDNSVTEILASHVFEHLNPYHVLDILKDWLRVLKPGGKLSMEMPDIEALCRRFVDAPKDERYALLNAVYGSVNTTGVGGPDNITSPHLFGWWPEAIYDHLGNAGYVNIEFMPEQIPHPHFNFRVEAYKPKIRTFDNDYIKSIDPITYYDVYEQNEYNVVNKEIIGKTIIDIGANIGIFSLMCLEKGAKKILAIEAQPSIFAEGLIHSVSPFADVITPLNYAVHDTDDLELLIPNNNVASIAGKDHGEPVKTITLETLLNRYNIEGSDLILKLDCEGSEFNILLNCKPDVLHRFEIIHVEFHTATNPDPAYENPDLIRNFLINNNYRCTHRPFIFVQGSLGEWLYKYTVVEKWVRNF